MKLFVRGDLDGFIGLGLDSLVNLIIMASVCIGMVGFPPSLIYGQILPGAALALLVGNVLYARLAHQLATKTGRTDVCALPYGFNTPIMIAYSLLIMGPARDLAQSAGMPHPEQVAWQAGLVACFCSGLVEVGVSFIAGFLLRITPQAAMLSTLGGIGLTFLAIGFLLQAVIHPIVGLTTLGVMLLVSYGGVRFRFGLSGILLTVLVGTSLCWLTGLAPLGQIHLEQLGFYVPRPALFSLWNGLNLQHLLPYLSVILPMSFLAAISSLQNIQSAASAGDEYPARPALIINGIGTLFAACFGSPFPLTIYIGHPGWKQMGARAGYSTLNGLFVALISITGAASIISWFIPPDAGLAIVIWIGMVIMTQAFEVVPKRHYIAIVMGLLPALGALLALTVKSALRCIVMTNGEHVPFDTTLLDMFHKQNDYIEGAFSLEQGFVFTGTIWAAITVYIVDKRFKMATVWSSVAMVFSILGLTNTWKWTANDTVISIPLLDRLTGQQVAPGWQGLFPGWPFALAYALLALIFIISDRFSIRDHAEEHATPERLDDLTSSPKV